MSIPGSKEMQIFYFGCWDDTGHYLWTPQGDRQSKRTLQYDQPWGFALDGGIQPKEGIYCRGKGIPHNAVLCHNDGWTALTFHDNTVDTRPGSVSVFLVQAVIDDKAIRDLAREHFPKIGRACIAPYNTRSDP